MRLITEGRSISDVAPALTSTVPTAGHAPTRDCAYPVLKMLEMQRSNPDGFRLRLLHDLESSCRDDIVDIYAAASTFGIVGDLQLLAMILRAYRRSLEPAVADSSAISSTDVFDALEVRLRKILERQVAPWTVPPDRIALVPAYIDFSTWLRGLNTLPENERRFVRAVNNGCGGKMDLSYFRDNGCGDIWTRPEQLGLIVCVGSFKWLSTCPDPLA